MSAPRVPVPRRRVTSADVARAAGVSRATVSYVLNDTPHQSIPTGTRQRVLEAARELQYLPSAAARLLRGARNDLVLGLVPDVPIGTKVGSLLQELSKRLGEKGFTFVIHVQSEGSRSTADLWRTLTPAAVVALGDPGSTLLQETDAAGVPVVVLGFDHPEQDRLVLDHSPDATVVTVGGHRAGVVQVEHLTARGHRHLAVALLDDPALRSFARARVGGVVQTCHRLGLPAPSIASVPGDDVAAAAAVLASWRTGATPVTAVCAYNDDVALALLAAARTLGLRVPGDLAVIGVDDLPLARSSDPPLSTVDLDQTVVVSHVVATVTARLAGGPGPTLDPDTVARLVVRAST